MGLLDGAYVETANGRERLASPGRDRSSGDPWTTWEGWHLCYAKDLTDGFTIRLQGYEFPCTVERFGTTNCVTFRRPGNNLTPFLVWEGCLVWTYLG